MKPHPALLICLLLSACVGDPAFKKAVTDQGDRGKAFKHKLVQNKFGCWEFERNPEYIAYDYGNAMTGVGGTFLNCMNAYIAEQGQKVSRLRADLDAKSREGEPLPELQAALQAEQGLLSEAVRTNVEWRTNNWK